MQKKLFIIGFNKTGTRSLHQLFEKSGYKAIHWDNGDLAYKIQQNIDNMCNPIKGYEEFDVFSDMEGTYGRPVMEAYRYFRAFYQAYPDALFLLNYRDVDDWLRSKSLHGFRGHGYDIYLQYYKDNFTYSNDEDVINHWRLSYYQHLADVIDFFKDKSNSLVLFNLDRDSALDLANRLKADFQLNPEHFKHVGKTTWTKEDVKQSGAI